MDGNRTVKDRLLSLLERAERKNVAERVKVLTAQLAVPPFPSALAYVWNVFWRLRRRSAPGMEGPAAIDWLSLQAFQQVTGLRLAPWEVELIEGLDDCYLRSVTEALEQKRNPSSGGDLRSMTQDEPRRTVRRGS